MNTVLTKMTLIAGVVLLTGCAAVDMDYDKERRDAEAQLEAAKGEGESSPNEYSNVVYEDEFYVPELKDEDKERPSWFFKDTAFSYRSTPFRMVVSDLFGEYSSVRYLQDIEIDKPVTLSHEGGLGEALEKLALSTGFAYTLKDGVLSWYKYRSESFDISFIPGAMTYFMGEDRSATNRADRGSSAGFQVVKSGNSANSNGGEINFQGESNVAEEFVKGIEIRKSPEGEYSVNSATSTLIVRDIPENVREIERYVEEQNKALTRQVEIKIQVVDVTFTDNEQTSLNLDLVNQSTGGSLVTTLASGAIPDGAQLLRGTLGATKTAGKWAGSSMFIDALKEQGVVSVVTEPKITTINNQVGQVKNEVVDGYLASVGSNTIANSGSTEQLIPGELTTGFKFTVLPKIKDDMIMLQLDAVLSELQELKPESDGNKTITVPNYTTKEFFLRNWIKNGETLMVSGLKNIKRDVRNDRGFLSFLFGGTKGVDEARTETVVLITPVINKGA